MARRKEIEPVPPEKIVYLKDGEQFDLGGETLEIMFAPGHQPNGIVIWETKNKGLFINDLVGNCFFDVGAHYPLNPMDSNNIQIIEVLKRCLELPVEYLYLGHYGISDKPREILTRSIDNLERLLAMAKKHVEAGEPERIVPDYLAMFMTDMEKLKDRQGLEYFKYATEEHQPFQANLFAEFCKKQFGKQSID
jgi:glyoxylase-like metal-dependent hydrolase (beta-lactamase superfamily II)